MWDCGAAQSAPLYIMYTCQCMQMRGVKSPCHSENRCVLVEDGVVRLAHISREHNCSDVLTHSLARPSFENHVATMFGEFTEGLNLVNARLGAGDWISQSRFTYYDTNP